MIGIEKKYHDSGKAEVKVTLSKQWKQYKIDLTPKRSKVHQERLPLEFGRPRASPSRSTSRTFSTSELLCRKCLLHKEFGCIKSQPRTVLHFTILSISHCAPCQRRPLVLG